MVNPSAMLNVQWTLYLQLTSPHQGNGGNGSCSLENVMASHENSGSAKTYDFMQRMFFFEPLGVFEDFAEGLTETGLKLKARHDPKHRHGDVEVINTSSRHNLC